MNKNRFINQGAAALSATAAFFLLKNIVDKADRILDGGDKRLEQKYTMD